MADPIRTLSLPSPSEYHNRKVALISGITGQDGSYLTEFLLSKGYHVHGIIRRSSSFNTGRLHHLYSDLHAKPDDPSAPSGRLFLHYGDLTDSTNLVGVIAKVLPSEIYNLGAQSHVKVSFEMAEYTGDVDALGTLRLLDAIRTCGLEKHVRFYQASTSELYGGVSLSTAQGHTSPDSAPPPPPSKPEEAKAQDELTPFYPRSPYGVAKLYAFWITKNYREAYGMFACNGILFNHESPRRGRTFVTRKITRAVAEIKQGKSDVLYLGNLDARRDWGHARDYIEGMYLMLQHDTPEDFVLATGQTWTVRSFVERAFEVVGVEVGWSGSGNDEVGFDKATQKVIVKIDPRYYRPAEVE
ncbi:hypothetical protein D9758_009996 [Tetrapyrgos nigripes]|uniref:GDP-mannose 4,6-dehydratase n=1 Tax=Tetrapyrgos nigripes TaxID=182062 RepID=A0A8H5CUW1_9AGAR|nr:hypothetical protein D9758_009996 [Tetrapyrgos nigripes]